MFKQLFLEVFDNQPKQTKKSNFRTITVAKPYCVPARNSITGIFQHYGVKQFGIEESVHTVKHKGEQIPALIIAKVKVSAKQAVWAEYLLLRSKRFILWGKAQDKRNEAWAAKHKAMPAAWNGKPLIEKNCEKF